MAFPQTILVGYIKGITETSAQVEAEVVYTDDDPISFTRGFVWATHPNPTLNDSWVGVPIIKETFTEEIGGLNTPPLSPNTYYYIRSYIASPDGLTVLYSLNEFQFRTLKSSTPEPPPGDGVKFEFRFRDINENQHKISIYRPFATDAIYEIDNADGNPIGIRHGGGDKNSLETTHIQGQEIEFGFFLPRDDVYLIDYLFESQYQDYVLEHRNEQNNLIFKGYIKPENLTKRYEKNPPYIEINLPANDGLADLSGFEFKDEQDKVIEHRITLLEAIKTALMPIAKSELNLPFRVQLNTYETNLMSSNECALSKIYIDPRSFLEGDFDNRKTVSCNDALYDCLKSFNLVIKQVDGYWDIRRPFELESYEYIFDFNTLSQISRTPTTIVKDITNFKFYPYIEEQKIHPFKSVYINKEQSSFGNDLIDNNWLNSWDFIGFTKAEVDPYSDDLSEIKVAIAGMDKKSTSPYFTLKQPVEIIRMSATDHLVLTFSYTLNLFLNAWAVSGNPLDLITPPKLYLKIELQGPNTDRWNEPTYHQIDLKSQDTVSFKTSRNENMLLPGSGFYNIRVSFYLKQGTFYHLGMTLSDPHIYLSPVSIYGNEDEGAKQDGRRSSATTTVTRPPVQSDRTVKINLVRVRVPHGTITQWKLEQTKGYEVFEATLRFTDFDIAAFARRTDADTLSHLNALYSHDDEYTLNWNVYNSSYNRRILNSYAHTLLENRQKYKNFLRTTVIDRNHEIKFNQIIKVEEKNYFIISYHRDYRNGEVELGLIELLTTPIPQEDIGVLEPVKLKSATVTDTTEPPLDFDGVEQEEHGFVVGDVIRYDADLEVYVKAQADDPQNAKAIGIVSEVLNEDLFRYISDGYIRSDSELYKFFDTTYDLELGDYYFLDPEEAGGVLKSAQLQVGDIEQCIGYVTTKGFKVEIDARMVELPGARTKNSVTGIGREGAEIELVGDLENPGPMQYYGTDASGEKSYHELISLKGEDGKDGDDGTSVFTYVAYASDNAGTGFSLTPTNLLKYRAEIHVATELTPPVAADFAGAIWVKYIGDDGEDGGGGGGAEPPELHIEFGKEGLNFTYPVPYNMKFTSQVSENGDATVDPPLNTNLNRYDRVTITATVAGLISLYGEYIV